MHRSSAEVRASADHPIIDADGHMLEVLEATYPYLRESLGAAQFQAWLDRGPIAKLSQRPRTPEERARTRTPQGAWWGTQTVNVRDRATATLPALLHERMDEIGIDFTVLYPTNTLLTCAERDDDLRRGLCHGFNEFYADVYGQFSDRMTAAAIIPMHTPEEAVAELEHCKAIGIKVVCFPEGVARPLEEIPDEHCSPWLVPGQRYWFDSYGLDSAYDYDPVWEACQRLGFAATFHGGLTVRPGLHWSISSYVANHIGQFAAEMYPLAKSLLLGGVTTRFPKLPFVLLECGVSWGMQLLADTIEHWEKRNIEAMEMLNPARLDKEALGQYYRTYAGKLADLIDGDVYDLVQRFPIHGSVPQQPDEFAAMQVSGAQDIVDRFVDSFWFGVEADDRGVATAFLSTNPKRAVLRAVLGSDIGHWDVTDIAAVVGESAAMVDKGVLTPEQWRTVVCDNAVEMFTACNPAFFDGTPAEAYARRYLAAAHG
jgi:predicted TIM-barrel fold metal-dependent hydrolase